MIAENERTPLIGSSRVLIIATIALVVLGVVVTRWMTTPFDDWVPLVTPEKLPAEVNRDDLPDAAHFRCSAVLADSESVAPTEQATAALDLQRLSREPCNDIRAQRRTVGSLNLVLTAGVLVVLLAAWRRQLAGLRSTRR